ncbi:MAG: hypothetical protein V2B20_24595 [Pseudomonadota bacterium]
MEYTLHFFRRMSGLITPVTHDTRLSRDTIFTLAIGITTVLLLFKHTGFERPAVQGVMARAEILAVIIFLVGGLTRKGGAAFLGAALGLTGIARKH